MRFIPIISKTQKNYKTIVMPRVVNPPSIKNSNSDCLLKNY